MAKSAIVIGAGIVGLATARALAVRGYVVTVLERSERAVGASIRNFGMIWPIGQPSGKMYERAMLSKGIWKSVCNEAGIWCDEVGSLHVAHNELEARVLEEFYEAAKDDRTCNLFTAEQTVRKWDAVAPNGLRLALYSGDEMIVDSREAIAKLPAYLSEKYGVVFHWNCSVNRVSYHTVCSGKKAFEADQIFVCSGADFETLFPEEFAQLPITKCKLQMIRTEAQPGNWRMGPALCGGLSLIHYKSFEAAASIGLLKQKLEDDLQDYLKWGIHVMAAQTQNGQITIGDSHEYGGSFDPFDKAFINDMILAYLKKFAQLKTYRIAETWNGIYPKLTDGRTEVVLHPQSGVTVINGLGGAGMTLSFGLCEQVIEGLFSNSKSIKGIV